MKKKNMRILSILSGLILMGLALMNPGLSSLALPADMIIPGLIEPPVRTFGAIIPEFESH